MPARTFVPLSAGRTVETGLLSRQSVRNLAGAVGRIVVDNQELDRLRQFKHSLHQPGEVVALVEGGADDEGARVHASARPH